MYLEFFQLFGKMNYNNQLNVIDFFKCLKGRKVECQNCKHAKINYENSFMLEFSLDVLFEYYKAHLIKNENEKYIISLEHCFENYVQPLFYKSEEENKICHNCKNKLNIKSQNEFYFFPNILIIVINKEIENNEYVFTFPEKLNLRNYISGISPEINKDNLNQEYNLKGIVTHSNSYNGKNYYAFCKHITSNKWNKYNDLIINDCKINDVIEESPDILIYECIPNNYITSSLELKNGNNIKQSKFINENTLYIKNNKIKLNININNPNINENQNDLININNNNINTYNDIENRYTREEINVFTSKKKKMSENENINNEKNNNIINENDDTLNNTEIIQNINEAQSLDNII